MNPSDAKDRDLRGDLGWVRRFRSLVARNIDPLCRVVENELGKPPFETLTAEIIPLLTACRWTEHHAPRLLAPKRIRGGGLFQIGQSHQRHRVPMGDVAIIATWNYPIQLLGVQLVHGLAAGNRVWVKPSERSPDSQGALLELAGEAGMGDERLRVAPASREAGQSLLASRTFDHVIFTGSTEVGRTIARDLAGRLTPSTLELSGSDSALVLADADPDLAARSIAFATRLNAGQTCMAPRRVIVDEAILDRFLGSLRRALSEERATTTPQPDELERSRTAAHAAVESGGRWISSDPNRAPFVVLTSDAESPLFLGHHFGPALAVVPARGRTELLAWHDLAPRRLATAVFTRDAGAARRDAPRLGSSVVTINDCVIPTGHPGVSIGGTGESGWGVSRGEAGLLAMTRPVCVSRTSRFVRTPTKEPGERVQRSLARWTRRLYG